MGARPERDRVDELLAIVEPPLRYFATAAPRRVAANALPIEAIEARYRDALAEAVGEARTLLDRLAESLRTFPLDAEAERRERAREALEWIERLRRTRIRDGGAAAFSPADPADGERLEESLELLARPVQYLKGVGPARAEQLGRFGIETLEDLLYHLPFRYEDRRAVRPLAAARPGATGTFLVEVVDFGERVVGRRRRRLLEAVVADRSGTLSLTWFHQVAFFASRLERGRRYWLHGKVQAGGGRLGIVHPELEPADDESGAAPGIVPVYEKPGEMSVGAMRKLLRTAIEETAGAVASALPAEVVSRRGLPRLEEAFRRVHAPAGADPVDALDEGRSEAHRGIVHDELFFLELGLLMRKHSAAKETGRSRKGTGEFSERFLASLPFALTRAQERVLAGIRRDLARPHPMHRLVQGDVGSGKTVVAVLAALTVVEGGEQAALMAPTEVLAEQHARTLAAWLDPIGVGTDLLTGRVSGAARAEVLDRIESGRTSIVVGTHALIQDRVRFRALGLGIVDEQHRFGVLQRKALESRGPSPDMLLMTATPIPRTLALTLYGDLEVSRLDEMPPGRRPIETRVLPDSGRDRAWRAVRRELDAGRQAYLVFPLVEESDSQDLRSAVGMVEELATGPLRGCRLGLLHGQMRGEEKDAVVRRFVAGDLQALVTTTVIEVGVDVPNATVVMIDHAERFGLAQLHQLRGRVGRGAERSHCLLVHTGTAGAQGRERLAILEHETDGSRIAEADLRFRGPGEFLGLRQSGLPDFRAANLVRDVDVLADAREDALAVLERDPGLRSPASAPLRRLLEHRWQGRLGILGAG